MQRIGKVVESAALRAALEELEANRQARQGTAPSSPQDAPGAPSKAGGRVRDRKAHSGPQEPPGGASMAGGRIRSLEGAKAAQRAAKAAQLEALAREAGMPPALATELANGLRAQAPTEWTFVMLSPSQHGAVVRWLTANSSRPLAALNLWAWLFEVMRNDTGQIMQSREELAAHLGIEPDNISRIMSELASINAIRRERSGRGVRYFMNSNVATHLPGNAARKLARETDGPLLTAIQGGRPNTVAE